MGAGVVFFTLWTFSNSDEVEPCHKICAASGIVDDWTCEICAACGGVGEGDIAVFFFCQFLFHCGCGCGWYDREHLLKVLQNICLVGFFIPKGAFCWYHKLKSIAVAFCELTSKYQYFAKIEVNRYASFAVQLESFFCMTWLRLTGNRAVSQGCCTCFALILGNALDTRSNESAKYAKTLV